MIACRNICKQYKDEIIFDNFTYTFSDNGFYLLYGESGCGKTTFLNILSGMKEFDAGEILYNNKIYTESVNIDEITNTAYITQECFFVDYLTVLDNMKLCSTNMEEIEHLLRQFDMADKKNMYTDKLSGGEKQRLAIMQALLRNCDILFLDEPTAALDLENKNKIFKLLSEIKTDKLIICSSHDKQAKEYADEIIDFRQLNQEQSVLNDIQQTAYQYNIADNVKADKENGIENNKKGANKQKNIQSFMNKMYSYPGREKKSTIYMIVIWVCVIIACCLSDTPESKINSNIEYVYKLNQLMVWCDSTNVGQIEKLKQDNAILETNLIYDLSVPDGMEEGQTVFTDDAPQYDTVYTISFQKEAFRLSDKLAYGDYYTREEQVILSYEKAITLGEPSDLIGKKITIDFYDKKYQMEICGVFEPLNDFDKEYLGASGIKIEGTEYDFFVNGKFMERYEEDKTFYQIGNRCYCIYFASFQEMQEFYNSPNGSLGNLQVSYADINLGTVAIFYYFPMFIYPVVVMTIILSLLFYFQVRKMEIEYKIQNFFVYQYYGYSIKQIMKAWIITNISQIAKMMLLSFSIAIPFTIIINMINEQLIVIPFRIFTWNNIIFISLIVSIFLISLLMIIKVFKKIKTRNWYEIFQEQKDLL